MSIEWSNKRSVSCLEMETESLTMNITFEQISNEITLPFDVSNSDCIIYRLISIIFTIISIASFAFNIRCILIDRHRLNPLTFSLIVNSIVSILLGLPYVLTQAIQCAPVQSYFICSFEGFMCFTSGICVIYTMCFLACIQYIRLFHKMTVIYRMIDYRNSVLIPFLCWFISLLWSLPPFVNIKPGFKREGQGFDCGLNWLKSDFRSNLYFFLGFLCIYILPLCFILYTHVYIFITIRKLIRRRYPLISKNVKMMSADMRHRLIYTFTVTESTRLKRLRIDRRFAKATMITVLYYSLAWTPYILCGILQMIFARKNIHYQLPSMLITTSALIAKMAVIGQSCVYFYIVQPSNKRLSLTSATLK